MTITQEAPSSVDPTTMRRAMATVPTSVSVVAGEYATSQPTAMVVGSFVSISLEPALVGFFVGLESTSWPKLQQCARLGISVLAEEQSEFARKITKKDPSRFDDHNWVTGPDREMLVHDAVLQMTGSIDSISRVGDHDFVVVELETLQPAEALPPLVFQDRQMTTVK